MKLKAKREAEINFTREKNSLTLKANSKSPSGDVADQKLTLRQEHEERIYQQKR